MVSIFNFQFSSFKFQFSIKPGSFPLKLIVTCIIYLRSMTTEKILILDFGSQYTQLIARAVREANVYCEIIPYNKSFKVDDALKGIILSGSPFSVNDAEAPMVDIPTFIQQLPVLGICYGAQLTAKEF